MCLVIILSQFFAAVLRFLTQTGKKQALQPGPGLSSVLLAMGSGLAKTHPSWRALEATAGRARDLHGVCISRQEGPWSPRGSPTKMGAEAEPQEERADVMCCPGGRGPTERAVHPPGRARGRTQFSISGSLKPGVGQGSHPRAVAQRTREMSRINRTVWGGR